MKKTLSKLFPLLVIVAIVLSTISFPTSVSHAASAVNIAQQVDAIGGLSASYSGDVVTITGSANRTTNLTLNMDSEVTINWEAILTGSATANNYLVTLIGNGTFTIGNGGSIGLTTGAGGTMYVSGGVTLNVTDGTITSSGSGSAVTIASGTQNARINVNGGTISSVPSGYAINDGSGMTASNNNTQINISDGLVESGSACAIRSTGIASIVNISGGEVRNAAASNTNSVIYMNYTPAPNNGLNNIVVSGGIVRTINSGNQSYVLQSTQNILVSGGEVMSIAGRTINLVGDYSTASVTGGRVSTIFGTAISTATTTLDDITNAKVDISGGIVEATETGRAVVITGSNSTVNISGNAQVAAKSGLAIDASGRPASDSVTVSGGFVFAWSDGNGNGITGSNNVINPAAKLNSSVTGVIASWNTSTGVGTKQYTQDERDDLFMMPANSVYWDDGGTVNDYTDDGIMYDSTLFKLNAEVIRNIYTLTIVTKLDDATESTKTIQVPKGVAVQITTREDTPISQTVASPLPDTNGDKFINWTYTDGLIGDANSRETTFVMPDSDVVVTANFKSRHLLHVDGLGGVIVEPKDFQGSSSYGYYAEGDEIIVSAAWFSNSMFFNYWGSNRGGVIENSAALVTKFTMPNNSVTLTAYPSGTSIPEPVPHKTDVISGEITITTAGAPPNSSSEHTALAGTGLRIEATIPAGNIFTGWVSSNGGWFTDKNSPSTVFVMPNEDTTITANYEPVFTLSIEKGSTPDGTSFLAGESVYIIADPPGVGKSFTGWTSTGDLGTFDNSDSASTIFTMPASNAEIKANYEDIQYTLTIINLTGTDTGNYIYDTTVPIIADTPPTGMKFTGWVKMSGNGKFGSDSVMNTTFTMPPENAIIIATYTEIEPLSPGDSEPDSSGDKNSNSPSGGAKDKSSGKSKSGPVCPKCGEAEKNCKCESANEPNTGDYVRIWLWILLGGVSMISLTYLYLRRKPMDNKLF